MIEIYTKPFCSFCFAAKNLMKQNGISYQETTVGDDETLIDELMAKSGRKTFPQIYADGEFIGGFDELQLLHSQGQLKAVLSVS